MIAVVQLPFWTLGVLFLALCWLAIGYDAWRTRRREGRREARRLHALDELWSDEVSERDDHRGRPAKPSLAASRSLTSQVGVGGDQARPSSSVSRGPVVDTTDAGTFPRVVKTIHGVPRETIYACTGHGDEAA